MIQLQRNLRFIFFSAWAVIMTALTYILGAPPLKVLRRRLGRAQYWGLTVLVSAGLYALRIDTHGPAGMLDFKMLAVAFFSLSVLMGVFDEFEEMGFSLTSASFFTLLINALLSAGAFALWVFFTGPKWSQTLLGVIESVLKPVAEMNPRIQINYFDLMLQIPSVAIVFWMAAIYVAVLMESRMNGGEMAPRLALPAMRPQLSAIRLPDACVWIFIVSILGAFGDFQIRPLEAIAVNALNVCMVLFFFQGIAVVAKFLERVRMGAFWQVVFMILIIIQLFLLVSLLGLVDYWLDIRARLDKRAEQFKRET